MNTRKKFSWITWTVMAVGAVVLLVGVIIPNWVRFTYKPSINACINVLRQIDSAKQSWAKEHGKQGAEVPALSNIAPYLGRNAAQATALCCPAGGITGNTFEACYEIGAVTNPPRCKILPRSHVMQ